MALPSAAPERQLKHRRQIDVQVFARGDGLWEVDAFLCDTKTCDVPLGGVIRPAGEPIHDMLLRLVVNTSFDILEAGATTVRMPYPGHCDDHGDRYGQLVGLNLMRGFRWAVAERLGADRGCTHLTELTSALPTAVVQAFAGGVIRVSDDAVEKKPFQLDRCHALRTDGEVVRVHYPRWYRRTAGAASAPASAVSGGGLTSTPGT
jgi:hypothetical protein